MSHRRVAPGKKQYCNSIEVFLTEEVWDCLTDSNKSLHAKLMKLAAFLQQGLNISCPSIQLLKRCISMLSAVHATELDHPKQKNKSS